MEIAPGYLFLPVALRREIDDALTTLPQIRGKISLTIEVNCSAPGIVGNITFKKSIEVAVKA